MWLAAGLLVFCAADVIFALRVTAGTYEVGTPVDLLWPLGMAIMASAPGARCAPRRRASATRSASWRRRWRHAGRWRRAAVGHRRRSAGGTIGLATASLVLAAGRTLVSFRELQRLADARRQARTDDLTGLANRRAAAEQAAARWRPPAAASGSRCC